MSDQTKQIFFIITASGVILLHILAFITKSFAIETINHMYMRLICMSITVSILRRSFKEQTKPYANQAIALCAGAILLDLVIVDGIRYILSRGISTILFLPACLPFGLMVIVYYTFKGREYADETRWIYWIGIPLLILALYFEIYSFTVL